MYRTDLLTAGLGSGFLAMIGAFFLFFLLILCAVYVYLALAWSTIAKKLKHEQPWLAWIPVANFALMLQLGDFHWAWVLLMLIPILGWLALFVLLLISTWRIYERRKYSGWLALIPLLSVIPFIGALAGLANLVVLGLVAWKDQ